MKSSLDLLGVVSLFGGEVAKGAIRYINANPKRCATCFLVLPGLYDVSSKMLRRSDSIISRVLSPGEREDKKCLVGLESSDKYKYVGTKSGTFSQVKNALCEGWLNRAWTSDEIRNQNSYLFNNKGRSTTVLSSTLTDSRSGSKIECLDAERALMVISGALQIGAFAALGYMIKTRDTAGIIISVANMVSSFLVTASITTDEYRVPMSKVSANVPDGNSIVTDKAGDNICVIMGKEKDIQSFMQLDVEVNEKNKYDSVAATIGCMTSIGTVLFTPAMFGAAQKIFALELAIGLLSNMVFSSRDGDRMLERMANKYYGQGISDSFTEIVSTKTEYTNRAAAIAAALIETEGKAQNISQLLPSVDTEGNWIKYMQLLEEVVSCKTTLPQLSSMASFNDAVQKLGQLFPDSAGKLVEKGGFSARLVGDVLEAIVQMQGQKPGWSRTL